MQPLDSQKPLLRGSQVRIEFALDLVRSDALLKTCYWYSRDYSCDIQEQQPVSVSVTLTAQRDLPISTEEVSRDFIAQALDFELRERVNMRTTEARDLLLAKAFAESGVLEDAPVGVFGDSIEEEKPKGLFKILQNG